MHITLASCVMIFYPHTIPLMSYKFDNIVAKNN